MGTVTLALWVSLLVSLAFLALDLVTLWKAETRQRSRGYNNRNREPEITESNFPAVATGSIISAAALFGFLLGVNFLIFYFLRPAMVGPYGGWMTIVLFDTIVGIIVFGVNGLVQKRCSLSTSLIPTVIVLWLMLAMCQAIFTPFSDQGAKKLAGYADIQVMPDGVYPETDSDHIIVVPVETAVFKARQKISQASDAKGNTLSTMYHIDCCVLQSINNHAYWVSEMRFNGWRISNTVGRVVPGYIVVDAEDPNAEPQVRLGYEMRYTPENFFENSLHRHLYQNGYRHYQIDDLTLEIDDNWKPFFSASLNRPAIRFTGSVPQEMVLVDPQTGEVHRYPLNKTPEFVDRIYSAHVANDFMTWWGRWSSAPWKLAFETTQGRYKPAASPTLVYTKGGHPAYQIMMTSQQSKDESIAYVALFEGRSNRVKLYNIRGISTESGAMNAFLETPKNVTRRRPVHPSMHKIYGQLTWVASYIGDKDLQGAASFLGVGLVSAHDIQGNNVVLGNTKTAALREYRQLIARGTTNQAPTEDSLNKTARGVVKEVTSFVLGGNTNYHIILESAPNTVFQGAVGEGQNPELPFVKPGAEVAISYFDTGRNVVDIVSYDDMGMHLQREDVIPQKLE